MKAVTVEPGVAGSVRYEEVPEPDPSSGSILVEAIAVGVCGTDVEIAAGDYGWAPPDRQRLILGHESLGRVLDPGSGTGLHEGDLVVGTVRRPDPVPCPNCAVGEWDMCRNGQYTERGIKEIDGFMSERWRIEPDYVTRLDPSLGLLGVLLEPTTVVAKAWELVAAMRARAFWQPRRALVTGAGPIGMMAALIGVQLGLEVHVLDRAVDGPKPQLVGDLGATYHADGSPPWASSRTSSSSAREWVTSSSTRSATWVPAAWSASRASGAEARRAGRVPRIWRERWSCATT